jgi:hypothetical protein
LEKFRYVGLTVIGNTGGEIILLVLVLVLGIRSKKVEDENEDEDENQFVQPNNFSPVELFIKVGKWNWNQ